MERLVGIVVTGQTVIFRKYLALIQAYRAYNTYLFRLYLANYSTNIRVDRTYYHIYSGYPIPSIL